MNTSLSNGFANFMLFKFMTRNSGYSECVIEGDDCLGVVAGYLPTQDDYAKLGFRIKIETPACLSVASFCGMIFDERDLQFIKDPIKILLNQGWSSEIYKNSNDKALKQLAKSKAMSSLAEATHNPITGVFFRRLYELTSKLRNRVDVTNKYDRCLLSQFVITPFAPTLRTRLLFEQVFGIPLLAQYTIEKYFSTWEYGPIECPTLNSYFSQVNFEFYNTYVTKYEPSMVLVGLNKNLVMAGQKNGKNRKRRMKQKRPPIRNNQPVKPIRKNVLSNTLGNLGGVAGSFLGGPAGGALGSALGRGAGALYNYVAGHGDYKVMSNSLTGLGTGTLPSFVNSESGNRIVHKEYIADVISSGSASTFSISKYPIQPAFTFPWLSEIAQQYQQYRINGMIFEFKTTSSDALNSTNTALGEIILATQYNVNNPDPVNAQQMYQLEYTSSCKPSMSILHPIECARGQSQTVILDTRNGAAASTTTGDLRLYDLGNFYIATNGLQGTSVNVGQLWVTYDISFLKPQLGNNSDVGDHYQLNSTVTTSNWFGTTIPVASSTSDLGSVISGVGGNGVITIPPTYTGSILMMYVIFGSSTAACSSPTVTASGGASNLNLFKANASSFVGPGTTCANYVLLYTVTCVAGGVITFTASTGSLPGSITNGDLFIVSWPTTLKN